MPDETNPIKLALNTPDSDEARMRQALGLREGAASERGPTRAQAERRARRFVRDGEVPVVVLNGPREHGAEGAPGVSRLAAAEAATAAERVARERAERALAEALSTVQHLRTQIGHAELAHQETLRTERAARHAAEAALHEAGAARDAAEARLAAEIASRPPPAPTEPDPAKLASGTRPGTRKRKAEEPTREPEPVKWWLPSYRKNLRKR